LSIFRPLGDFRQETRATFRSVDEQLADITDLIIGRRKVGSHTRSKPFSRKRSRIMPWTPGYNRHEKRDSSSPKGCAMADPRHGCGWELSASTSRLCDRGGIGPSPEIPMPIAAAKLLRPNETAMSSSAIIGPVWRAGDRGEREAVEERPETRNRVVTVLGQELAEFGVDGGAGVAEELLAQG
jgi:hypothetical protein